MPYLRELPANIRETHEPLVEVAKKLKRATHIVGGILTALEQLPEGHEIFIIIGGKTEVIRSPRMGSFIPRGDFPRLKKFFAEFETESDVVAKLRKAGIKAPSNLAARVRGGKFGNVPFVEAGRLFMIHKSIYKSGEMAERRQSRE